MKIVFMGTPRFSIPCLQILLDNGHDVTAVVTQTDKPKGRGNILTPSPVKAFAAERGIKVLQPQKVRTGEFETALRDLSPDLGVVAAYGKILPANILDIPKHGCINIHASLLPYYRGAAPINRAVMNGEHISGITTMRMDEGLDTGDILMQKQVEIGINMTAGELHDILSMLGAEVLKATLISLENNSLKRTPQCNDIATYAPMMTKEDGRIDWSKDASDIHNQVRGVNPRPGAFTSYCGKRMKIWKTLVCDENGNDKNILPGTIAGSEKNGLRVVCGKGKLEIIELQMDNSRRMRIEECWHNIHEGIVLG